MVKSLCIERVKTYYGSYYLPNVMECTDRYRPIAFWRKILQGAIGTKCSEHKTLVSGPIIYKKRFSLPPYVTQSKLSDYGRSRTSHGSDPTLTSSYPWRRRCLHYRFNTGRKM